jgi:hypothetical protein
MYRLEREIVLPGLTRFQSVRLIVALALLTQWAPTPALAWGGRVRLARRYQSGQKMVYATKMHTKAVIHSEPPELQNFLPPLPTNFSVQQQNTVTVKAVHSDGSADIENHFDKFEFQSDLASRVPANFRDPAVSAQKEISEHVATDGCWGLRAGRACSSSWIRLIEGRFARH